MTTEETTQALNELLAAHNVRARVTGATVGPTVTTYEVELEPGVKPEAVLGLQKSIAYRLGTDSVRIHVSVQGRPCMGIELPNEQRRMVSLADVPVTGGPLEIPLGVGADNQPVTVNLAKLPHLLAAGETGGGKSVFVNSVLATLLKRNTPEQLRLVLIDPKMVELAPYEGIPHLLRPVVTSPGEAVTALGGLVDEMERRYAELPTGVRDIDTYNAMGGDWPRIVVVVDELADLMMTAGKACENAIVRLAQKARAVGIHLVLATQQPVVKVVTGLIKANVPARVSFAVSSMTNSRVILDCNGAESLLGNGDGLYKLGHKRLARFQSVFVSDAEVAELVASLIPAVEPEWPEPQPQPVVTVVAPREQAPQRVVRQPRPEPERVVVRVPLLSAVSGLVGGLLMCLLMTLVMVVAPYLLFTGGFRDELVRSWIAPVEWLSVLVAGVVRRGGAGFPQP